MYDILVGGKKVGSYDNTGSFGELALMYNMPRAATIIATTTGTLWAMVCHVLIVVVVGVVVVVVVIVVVELLLSLPRRQERCGPWYVMS